MGHQLLSDPPNTQEWLNIVSRINHGDNVCLVANAAVQLIKKELTKACNDPGLIEAAYLLCNIPQAALNPAFAEALHEYGVHVNTDASLPELLMALTGAMDNRFLNSPHRTDLNEMAQAVLVEAVSILVESKLQPTMFSPDTEQMQQALAQCHMRKDFGQLAKEFFGRLMFKCIDYFLGRTLTEMVGEGKRFGSFATYRGYMRDLKNHCIKTAEVLSNYSKQWLQKEYRVEGSVTREAAGTFLFGAMAKLVDTLTQTEIHRAA